MSNTDKGVLMFNEWLDAMNELTPKDYKQMMTAIYRYQMKGEQPPEFKGKARIIATMVFPYVKRRIAQANGGKKAMAARRERLSDNPIVNELLQKRAEERSDGIPELPAN